MNELDKARLEIDGIDKEMARLFEKRMEICSGIAVYKMKNALPVFDPERESAVIQKGLGNISDERLREYYRSFLENNMDLSKRFQSETMNIPAPPVYMKRGGTENLSDYFSLERKALVVTDSGVPKEYSERVLRQCKNGFSLVIPQGEKSKSLRNFEIICETLLENKFSRGDCVIALGGGMVGDLSGFAASTYMRGIDFYNIPTTVLSQVDSSIGGKTAVNLSGIKNSVGTFSQPKAVLVDTSLLSTLAPRQFANGMAEAVKMAATLDEELFGIFENCDINENIETVISRSIVAKQKIVFSDEHESGIRQVLNFGHTIGHAIESLGGLFHGECVAIGMLPMCEEKAKARLEPVLKKLGLPTEWNGKPEELSPLISHDKKSDGERINTVICDDIGKYHFEKLTAEEVIQRFAKGDTRYE